MENERIDRRMAFTSYFFFRKDSIAAANELIKEFQRRDGKLTTDQMVRFVHKLEMGEPGFKFSKQNFYGSVLRMFREMGFIKRTSVWSHEKGKTIWVYLAINQPVPTHAPEHPSFMYVAYQFSRWWNDIIFRGK